MIAYHVFVTTADDYPSRREPYRKAHLERLMELRSRTLCVGGGPAPDGRSADVFYRVEQPGDITRLIEDDPYYTGGAWIAYRARSFSQFLEPWEFPPLVLDGSRRATIVEGEVTDPEMAAFALIEARGAGRMAFGGVFPDGQSLSLMRSADQAEAVAALEETGFWKPGTLRGRPLLHVL
jgi:uncharacterized protein YciI